MNGFELYNEQRKIEGKVKADFVIAFDIQKRREFEGRNNII